MNWLTTRRLELGGSSVTFGALAVALLVILAGFLLAAQVASRIQGRSLESAQGWRRAASKIVGYVLRAMAVAVALQVAGIDIASVLAASAVLAVGIGIAMQKVAENFVSGIILLAERSIREGDIIEFEGRIARVQHMGIRATIAQTLDDDEIIVPNSILTQSAVKNLTLTEPVYRLRVRVGVAYSTDVDQAFTVLREAVEGLSWRDPRHAPVVLLLDFGASSLEFEVSVWTRDVWALRRGQSEMRHVLWRALRAAAITIPFPQMDVHLDAPLPPPTREG